MDGSDTIPVLDVGAMQGNTMIVVRAALDNDPCRRRCLRFAGNGEAAKAEESSERHRGDHTLPNLHVVAPSLTSPGKEPRTTGLAATHA